MLIRQTLLYLPAQVLAPAAQFISVMVWTWWLAPAEMGTFALVTATQELAYLATISWLSVYVLRYGPADIDAAARLRFLGTETTVLLIAAIPQALAALLTVALLDHNIEPPVMFLAVAAYFVTRSASSHYAERARSQTKIFAYTLFQVAGPVGGLAVGLAALSAHGPTAVALIVAYALAQAVGLLVGLPMIGAGLPRKPDRQILASAIAYGGPVLVLMGLGWMAENNIRYVVEHAAGAAAFGLLAVGWGIGRRAASFASMLVTAAAFPLAARLLNAGDRESALGQLSANAALLAGVLFPAVAGLAFVGDGLVDIAVAETYRETTKAVLTLSALSGAIHFLHVHVTGQLFVLVRKFAYAAFVDAVEVIATMGLTMIGLSTHGLVGAVAGATAGSMIAAAISLVFACRLGFRVPVADAARVAVATIAMSAILSQIHTTPTVVGLLATIAVGVAVYGAAIALLYGKRLVPIVAARIG